MTSDSNRAISPLIAVILCGGSGSRLFPLSRANRPKQFLELENNGLSLLQNTLLRCETSVIGFEKIALLSNRQHEFLLEAQVASLDLHTPVEIFYEPVSRNTAPAIALVMKHYFKKQGFDGNLFFMPSDHIYDTDAFNQLLQEARTHVHDKAVIFGIRPTYPETGYGYIEFEDNRVLSFKEKPTVDVAKGYVQEGRYYWNSGMFMFHKNVLPLFRLHNPDTDAVLDNLLHQNLVRDGNKIYIHADYGQCQDISIDYALMEHISADTAFVPYHGSWSDIGSFQSLLPYSKEYLSFGCDHLYVNTKKPTVASNVHDLIIVETEDVLLVADIRDSQNIKQVYNLVPESMRRNESIDYRPWGFYEVLKDEDLFKSKKITVFPGKRLSLQSHKRRAEHWICLQGQGKAEINGVLHELVPNKQVFINFEDKHRMINDGKENLVIIEIQTGSYFGEDDIIRYQDDYGRN